MIKTLAFKGGEKTMLRWLRLVMVGCLIISISIIATGCKKESAMGTKPAVEEKAPAAEVEE